jgi:GNAT superfamily N-acetyltransferase
MFDLLVKLYGLPSLVAPAAEITVRRAFAAERSLVCDWIAAHFGAGWASESEAAFARLPVACFIAVRKGELLGFACYDATARGFFGPTGVAEPERKRGVGYALLLAALHDMAAQGYAYAIIGRADSPDFYRKHAGAIDIPDSDPGFYRGLIKSK